MAYYFDRQDVAASASADRCGGIMAMQRRARGGPVGWPSPAIHENPFDDVIEQVDRAAAVLGLTPRDVEMLKHPKRQVIVSLPVAMDDGRVEMEIQGPRERLELMMKNLGEQRFIEIDNIDEEIIPVDPHEYEFKVRY